MAVGKYPIRVPSLICIAALVAAALHATVEIGPPPCPLLFARGRILMPAQGFRWAEGTDEAGGNCEAVPAGQWTQKASGEVSLFVHADGPSGSGRYWTIHAGVGEKGARKPSRGVCLTTSTVGWRTLQQFRNGPLPWLDDVDGDGKAEFILWQSFPLHRDSSMAEYGLTAWAYRISASGDLVLDLEASRRLAGEVAAAYRKPSTSGAPSLLPARAKVANALEQFAQKACSLDPLMNLGD